MRPGLLDVSGGGMVGGEGHLGGGGGGRKETRPFGMGG